MQKSEERVALCVHAEGCRAEHADGNRARAHGGDGVARVEEKIALAGLIGDGEAWRVGKAKGLDGAGDASVDTDAALRGGAEIEADRGTGDRGWIERDLSGVDGERDMAERDISVGELTICCHGGEGVRVGGGGERQVGRGEDTCIQSKAVSDFGRHIFLFYCRDYGQVTDRVVLWMAAAPRGVGRLFVRIFNERTITLERRSFW